MHSPILPSYRNVVSRWVVRWSWCLLAFLVWIRTDEVPVLGADATATSSGTTHVVRGRLLKPDGSPAAGRKVLLIGLERASLVMTDEAPNLAHWHWTTDGDGRFEARFEGRRHDPSLDSVEDRMPIGGRYHFVVPADPSQDAGAISVTIYNSPFDGYSDTDRRVALKPDEWGKPVELTGPSSDLELRLNAGVGFGGRVLDQEDRPVSGTEVGISYDLGAATHTGFGGEVLAQEILTGADGTFRFTSVYPTTFTLRASLARPGTSQARPCCWERTRVGGGAWVTDCVDKLSPTAPAPLSVEIGLRVAEKGQTLGYRVTGHVTKADGAPAAGAKIAVGFSSHREPRSFGDDHSFAEGVADATGAYSVDVRSPWLRFVHADLDGAKAGVEGACETEDSARTRPGQPLTLPPGRYDLQLRP